MGREELKNALQTAGLHPDELAEIVEVDVKTVQRWLSTTRVPHSRHRLRIAQALNLTETDIWPELLSDEASSTPPPPTAEPQSTESVDAPIPSGDLVAGYTDVTHPGVPPAYPALIAACKQIDIVRGAPTSTAWRQLLQIVEATAEHHVPTRLLIRHPTESLPQPESEREDRDQIIRQLAAAPQVKLGQILQGNYEFIVRADHQLFVSIALGQTPYERCPHFHIQRTTHDGMFDRFAAYLDQQWEHAQPVLLSTGRPPPPPSAPRRWPGRTD